MDHVKIENNEALIVKRPNGEVSLITNINKNGGTCSCCNEIFHTDQCIVLGKIVFTDFGGCSGVKDISTLKGASISVLLLDNTSVADLSPVAELTVKRLSFTPSRITKGIDVIRRLPELSTVSDSFNRALPAPEFWKRYDAGEFTKKP